MNFYAELPKGNSAFAILPRNSKVFFVKFVAFICRFTLDPFPLL